MKVFWDFSIFTDHHLAAQCLDIVVLDKQTKMSQIIDMAVPADNVSMKEKEKIDKSCFEQLLWKVCCEVIPLVIDGLGCITNMLQGINRDSILVLLYCRIAPANNCIRVDQATFCIDTCNHIDKA